MNCNCKDVVDVSFFSELREDGVTPIQDMKYAKEGDACVDIRCKQDVIIRPDSYEMIATGLFMALPLGYEFQLRPRSGLSAKTNLIFKNTIGTIDAGYRNEIFVIWYNLGSTEVKFAKYDRICQGKVERVLPVVFNSIESLNDLQSLVINRGGGFGHTGLS
jgi:dUTP pyrophosphatase